MAAVCRRMVVSTSYIRRPITILIRGFATSNSNRQIIKPTIGTDPSLQAVRVQNERFDKIHVRDFRELAFTPELPLHMTKNVNTDNFISHSFPISAAYKWFRRSPQKTGEEKGLTRTSFNYAYLDQFGDHVFNFEAILSSGPPNRPHEVEKFFQIQAPLHNLIASSKAEKALGGREYRMLRYYLAQTQIIDLPKQMQEDIKTPELVLSAGKGDIYDANIWIGQPSTYTPLHKDPNPNFFVQIASDKIVRIYEPKVGAAVFRDVQMSLGASASSVFRGEEMMDGPERGALDQAVWGEEAGNPGYEVFMKAGDALFIPKGWWHSIKSVGPDINASINWWFR